jgi:S-methylmethionine-dependent homocysteine/selenocysteine methylase
METANKLLKEGYYLTDGGLETTLIFHDGIELNHFAAFELLNDPHGTDVLRKYYQKYLDLARNFNTNFILDSPTWRANPDWGFKLGYSAEEISAINKFAIALLRKLQAQPGNAKIQTLVSGAIGPKGDGYVSSSTMKPLEAKDYHTGQIRAFKEAGADMVTAFTINYSDEATGIVLAAKALNIPVVISLTLETDGRLPGGEKLKDAIEATDAETGRYASYYMINCAHPEHFKSVLKTDSKWKNRIWGIRANASTKSHKELDESETLDVGDKCLLAEGYFALVQLLPNLRIIGGCCGTDHTHLEEVSKVIFNANYRLTNQTAENSLSQKNYQL